MAKTVILLSGKKNTGKDTAGTLIKKLLKCPVCLGKGVVGRRVFSGCTKCHGDGSRVETMSFADPLKKFCIDVLGLSKQQCYGQSGERETETPIRWADINLRYSKEHADKWMNINMWDAKMSARDILQIVGTDVLRSFYQGIWANAAYLAAKRSSRDVVVFTDTRFPNEITEFQRHQEEDAEFDVIVIRLYREQTAATDNHPSEKALDDWDSLGKWSNEIHNDGAIADLGYQLKSILSGKYGLI